MNILNVLSKLIIDSKNGRRIQRNGKRLRPNSIRNYVMLKKYLVMFSTKYQFKLKVQILNGTQLQFCNEKTFWNDFYFKFTKFLYNDLGHRDNNVGRNIKLLKSIFNYINEELGYNIGTFHKRFYSPSEEVDFVILSPNRINQLIHSTKLELILDNQLLLVKDIFLLGCVTALRYSDLSNLTDSNIEPINGSYFIKIKAKKTNISTRIKLPDFAMAIINKYKHPSRKQLLPFPSNSVMNKRLKKLMEYCGFTEPVQKSRLARGLTINLFRKNNETYRFCDLVSTHTMRRTAITNMLYLGMNENTVRQISGHSPNSKEFFRYVNFSQSILDQQINIYHDALKKSTLLE